jgi:hypothetical protein
MTWRACSPPWPDRRNPGNWPGRRRCGPPSARSASHPLPGGPHGTDGPGGLGRPVPESGWPRCWSQQWPGWAASLRPIRTCCPAPFNNWLTSPWRHRPRTARYRPPTRRERGTPRLLRSGQPAARLPDPAIRRAPLRDLAGGRPRGHTFRRPSGHHRVTPPRRPATPFQGTGRFRRRRHRPAPAWRQPLLRRRPARAPSCGPRASPPCTRPLPDAHPSSSTAAHATSLGRS